MNYGKQNLSKRKNHISSKKRMKKKRVGVRFFKALIICMLLLAVICVVGIAIMAKRIIDNTPNVTAEDIMPKGYTTTIVDQNGTVIETLKDSDSNRVYRSYDEIPEYLAHAFVAIEDERFYDHNGIDLQGILRAGVVGITNGFNFSEGASTITQQLIKNNVFPNFVSEETMYDRVERKLQEQYLAIQIEKEMDKKEILEAYMNTINLGQGCLGVQTASTRYFNKEVSDLTLSECAVIAAITKNPTGYDPVTHPDANESRRKIVLDNMLEQGWIIQTEYDEAIADPVYDRILKTAANTDDSEPYSYFVDALIDDVIEDLINEKGYTETQAYNLLYTGGLTIKSTQDSSIQKICDEEVANIGDYLTMTEYGIEYALTVHRADGTAENYSKEQLGEYIKEAHNDKNPFVFSSEDEARAAVEEYKSTLNIDTEAGDTVDEKLEITLQPQTSVVIIDQYTGQVKAIVGGRGEKKSSRSLNRATDSTKQPGSAFKIVSTYAPALNECDMTLASLIKDEPYNYTSGKAVNNWDHKYIGWTTTRYAILHSMNVCAVRTLTETVGLEKGYDYLLKFGFTTLVDGTDPNYKGYTDIAQSTALGGITRGVYNLEMTASYAAIANGGEYTEPTFYTEILDHDGNVLIDNTVPDTHEVIKESTAYLLTSAMEDVVTRGTGTVARLDDMTAAGKTGTTDDSTSLWFVGYTPYYTAGVWGGYDDNKSMEGMNANWRTILWKNIMNRVHENLENKEFDVPSTIVRKTICTETGLLAVSGCPSMTEYFDKDTVATQSCPGHAPAEPEEPDEDDDDDNTTDNNDNRDPSDTDNQGNTDQPSDGNQSGDGANNQGGTNNQGSTNNQGGTNTPSNPSGSGQNNN